MNKSGLEIKAIHVGSSNAAQVYEIPFYIWGNEGVRKSKPDAEGVIAALLSPDTDDNEAN